MKNCRKRILSIVVTVLAGILCVQTTGAAFIPSKPTKKPAAETTAAEVPETEPEQKPVTEEKPVKRTDTVYPDGKVYVVPRNETFVNLNMMVLNTEYNTVYIGAHVEEIGLYTQGNLTIDGSGTIANIHVDPKNPRYASKNGILYNKEMTELLFVPVARKNMVYTIPKTVRYIHEAALNYAYIKYHPQENDMWIQVEDGSPWFTVVGDCVCNAEKTILYYINDWKTDRDVYIPDTVQLIHNHAFQYRNPGREKRIHIPASVRRIENDGNMWAYTFVVVRNSTAHVIAQQKSYSFVLNGDPACSPLTLGEITTSAQNGIFATAPGNRLYINVPCLFTAPEGYIKPKITAVIYDSNGKTVGSLPAVNTLYQQHVILSWNGMAAKNNAAGISTGTYVPAGTYTIRIRATATLFGHTVSAPEKKITVQVQNGGKTVPYGSDNTVMTPIYTSYPTLNYMVDKLLEEIIRPEMTNAEKLKAVYTWMVKNCTHGACTHCVNGLDYYGDIGDAVYTLDRKVQSDWMNGKIDMQPDVHVLNHNGNSTYNPGAYTEEIRKQIWSNEYLFYPLKAEYLLIHRSGICSYFAGLFSVIVNRMGFESGVVIGDYINNDGSSTQHYWNYVKLNGSYYWVDTDISAILYKSTGTVYESSYFLKKDTDAVWTAHHRWNAAEYPACQ